MLFNNKLPNPIYVVIAKVKKTEAGRTYVQGADGSPVGIYVEFRGHQWDSEQAQKANHWTDEQREVAESYLKEHSDYGRTMRSMEDNSLAAFEMAQMSSQPRAQACLYVVVTPSGPNKCGKSVFPGTDYCRDHLLEVVSKKTEESDEPTARERTPEQVEEGVPA